MLHYIWTYIDVVILEFRRWVLILSLWRCAWEHRWLPSKPPALQESKLQHQHFEWFNGRPPFSWSRVCFCSNSWKVTSRINRCLRIVSSIRCRWSVSERRCSKPSFTCMCRFSSPAICSKYRTRTWSHLPMINVETRIKSEKPVNRSSPDASASRAADTYLSTWASHSRLSAHDTVLNSLRLLRLIQLGRLWWELDSAALGCSSSGYDVDSELSCCGGSSSPYSSRWDRRRIGRGSGDMIPARREGPDDVASGAEDFRSIWGRRKGWIVGIALWSTGGSFGFVNCSGFVKDRCTGNLADDGPGALEGIPVGRRGSESARCCWSLNHFSISLTRNSAGATKVWKAKPSSRDDLFDMGRVVFANFLHLRTMRSLRCRISIMRSQEMDGFLVSS